MSMHHYRCLALCFITICKKGRFWAASLASGSSTPNEDRSLQTFWIQVERGFPGGLLQLSGGCGKKFRLASANSFIRATCPNRGVGGWDLTMEESGGCWVIPCTASFLVTVCQSTAYLQYHYHYIHALTLTSSYYTMQYSSRIFTKQPSNLLSNIGNNK